MFDVCIISDGKPGHVNQSLGLLDALRRARPSLTYTERTVLGWYEIFGLLWARLRKQPTAFDQVRVVIGAGSRTHFSLLVLQGLLGCKAVVLMRPVCTGLFAACIIPEHDQPAKAANILPTLGVLNRMSPGDKHADRGLMLIGGVSKHGRWDDQAIWAQIEAVLADNPQQNWVLTTSRRTPESFLQQAIIHPQLEIVPVAQTPPHWLQTQLAHACTCWVTQDSVSMVYESLSAGCQTGILELPEPVQPSRVSRGLARLKASMRVMTLAQRQLSTQEPLAEAERAALWILAKGWL